MTRVLGFKTKREAEDYIKKHGNKRGLSLCYADDGFGNSCCTKEYNECTQACGIDRNEFPFIVEERNV